MPRAHAQYPTEREFESGVVRRVIGSRGFLWVMGAVGMVVLALLSLGAEAWVQKQAVQAPEFVASKAEVDTLKVAVSVIGTSVDKHTEAMKNMVETEKRTADLEGKIFESLKGLSADVHAIDYKVGVLGQKVDDQALRITDLQSQRK